MPAKKSLFDRTGKKLQHVASIAGAIVALTGVATGVFSWVSQQFANAVSAQISDFREETKETNDRHEQSLTRIELSILIEHDPENIVAIERMARYYFQELDGDLYMTQKYSDWAREYGGDTSIIIGAHK